jgi:hypothetical protein
MVEKRRDGEDSLDFNGTHKTERTKNIIIGAGAVQFRSDGRTFNLDFDQLLPYIPTYVYSKCIFEYVFCL